jgi:hypothetical protein
VGALLGEEAQRLAAIAGELGFEEARAERF